VPSLFFLVIGGVLLWTAVSVLAVALCRGAAQGDRTVIEPGTGIPELSVTLAADRGPKRRVVRPSGSSRGRRAWHPSGAAHPHRPS
jgi:hypothetical protein